MDSPFQSVFSDNQLKDLFGIQRKMLEKQARMTYLGIYQLTSPEIQRLRKDDIIFEMEDALIFKFQCFQTLSLFENPTQFKDYFESFLINWPAPFDFWTADLIYIDIIGKPDLSKLPWPFHQSPYNPETFLPINPFLETSPFV